MIEWTSDIEDVMLNEVLSGATKGMYRRALVKIANRFSIGVSEPVRDGDPVRRRLWGLATRCVEYTPSDLRRDRRNTPWTYGELQVLKWAFVMDAPKEANGCLPPDNEYIARLLCRTVEEVKEKRGITKQGVKGFGIL